MPPQAGETIEQYEVRIAAREAALAVARAERERQAGLARDGIFNFAEAQDKDRKAARAVAQNTPGPIRRKKSKAGNALKRKRKLPTDITDTESEPEGELPDITRPPPPKPTSGWHRNFYPKSSNADPSPCLMRRPIPKKPWLADPVSVSVETPKKSKSKKARTAEWVAGSTSAAAAPAGAMIEGAGVLGPASWAPLPDLFAEFESEEEVEENEGEEEKWESWSQESVEI
ncbi:hypothetical protein DFP72DRAFT_856256 [Ephemerocybe angulata]|uniref:Uncharacterized protein n=1 Tax=Ephemerocybe angulata TaxID=980116 RepID=A0A8H6HGB7_9AGAR|nr:hypothetical protein DFP72DRAFT_856256 [Tulosesus angulatus]